MACIIWTPYLTITVQHTFRTEFLFLRVGNLGCVVFVILPKNNLVLMSKYYLGHRKFPEKISLSILHASVFLYTPLKHLQNIYYFLYLLFFIILYMSTKFIYCAFCLFFSLQLIPSTIILYLTKQQFSEND